MVSTPVAGTSSGPEYKTNKHRRGSFREQHRRCKPNRNVKMLFTVVGWSHFDEALLWLSARQLIGKMFSLRKGHLQRYFNKKQNQNKMGLLSMKTIQTATFTKN